MSTTTVKVGKRGRYAGWWRVRDAIKAGLAFSNSTGTFRGGPTRTPEHALRGQLPTGYLASLHRADYIVWSYQTPIAWRTGNCWVTPDEHYSPTTRHHQGQTNTAICAIETDLT